MTVSLFLQKPTSTEGQRAQSFGALRGRSLPSGCDQLQGKPTVSFFFLLHRVSEEQKVITVAADGVCVFVGV